MTKTYKGYSIDKFVVEWLFNGKTSKTTSWIILSPYYLQTNPDGQKTYLPLYCENEYGELVDDFKTLKQAKDYVDHYLVPHKVELMVKHGEEITAVVKDEFRKERGE